VCKVPMSPLALRRQDGRTAYRPGPDPVISMSPLVGTPTCDYSAPISAPICYHLATQSCGCYHRLKLVECACLTAFGGLMQTYLKHFLPSHFIASIPFLHMSLAPYCVMLIHVSCDISCICPQSSTYQVKSIPQGKEKSGS